MEPLLERHEPFAFETPVRAEDRRWWSDAERGALAGALATSIGSLPSMIIYLRAYWETVSPDVWRLLAAQTATFVVATGVVWGAAVGAAIGLTRGAGAIRRGGATGFAGALATAPAGAIAALHFGQMTTPYFGGASILLAAFATLVLAGVGFARLAGDAPFRRAVGCSLGAAPMMLLVLSPVGLALPSAALFLELDEMRFVAATIGLGPMGAAVGAILGSIGGAWMGLCATLAATSTRERAYVTKNGCTTTATTTATTRSVVDASRSR